jgi:dihydrolipoamide dehydrogenase
MEVKVPDIGDFADVPVIEIHVKPGDTVAAEDPLITLESEKATMDVPAPAAGKVTDLHVSIDDKVSEGSLILTLETSQEAAAGETQGEPAGDAKEPEPAASAPEPAAPATPAGEPAAPSGRVVVIGSGPGGYAAAFRAADLGLEVVLVERYETLGGVCLNVGCIPSKALLHTARVIAETEEAADFGLKFKRPKIDLDALREWKSGVVGKLTGGLAGLARQREVKVITGTARFTSPQSIDVDGTSIDFDHCIIAAGSRAAMLPGLPDDERIGHSTGALELPDIPERLLVIGGGIIGLELATVYEALGSAVSVVELTDQLIPGCDRDLVKPLHKRIEARYEAIMLSTRVASAEAGGDGIRVTFEGDDAAELQTYDRVLVAVGRQANGDRLDLDRAGVNVDEHGVIPVDAQRRTNVPHIYAIGDVAGSPMLAHKATHEGKAAAEVIAGRNVAFDPRAIPSVAYTDPEVAWTGLTETEAVAAGTDYEKAVFPWQASGRALSLGRPDGLTKLLIDPQSRRVLGMGIVGVNAGDLITEATLAIEMGADAEDVGLTIHPHPTLSETVAFSAEMAEGTVTDLYVPRRKSG